MTIDPAFNERLAQLTLQSQVMWGIAVATLCLLIFTAYKFRGRLTEAELPRQGGLSARLRDFHDSSSAIASMEFLMVFFPFLIIVLTVWQLAFMFNAQIHVGYAAYAAARSASVVIPEDVDGEPEYEVKVMGQDGAQKWQRIRRAAMPGLIAISPGNAGDAFGVAGLHATQNGGLDALNNPVNTSILARMGFMTVHQGTGWIFEGNRETRAGVKNLYAEAVTQVLVNDKGTDTALNLTSADTISVTVKYPFFLNVPLVGRLIESTMKDWKNPATGKLLTLNPFPSMELSETIHMKLWSRKRTIDPESC